MRTRSQENRAVNDIWLCDKGWFGYEFSSHPDRLNTPLIRRNGQFAPGTWEEAFDLIASKMQQAKSAGKIAGWGGNPLTVEEIYLFQQLLREGCGVNNVDHRINIPIHSLDKEGSAPGMEISIGDTENLSYAVLCGLDLTEEFPVIWLRLKQAINKGAKVYFIGHYGPEIAPHLKETILHSPGQELESLRQFHSRLPALDGKGAIFLGRQYLDSPHRLSILSELQGWNAGSINVMEGRGNSMGARFAGMHPEVGPLGEKTTSSGLDILQVLEKTAKEGWDVLYIAGADPARQLPTKLWNAAKEKLGFLVVQDLFLTDTAKQADVVLPTLSFVEKEGSFINIEGRVQKLLPGKALPAELLSDGEIFFRLAKKLDLMLTLPAAFLEALAQPGRVISKRPAHAGALTESPPQSSEGLLATFAPALFDHGTRMRHNPHVIQLAREPRLRIHPREAEKHNLQMGDTVRLTANGNAITAKVKLDARVAAGTIVIPLGFEKINARDLSPKLQNGFSVQLERVS